MALLELPLAYVWLFWGRLSGLSSSSLVLILVIATVSIYPFHLMGYIYMSALVGRYYIN